MGTYLEALEAEHAGYVARGLDDRAAEVAAEIARARTAQPNPDDADPEEVGQDESAAGGSDVPSAAGSPPRRRRR